MRVDLFDYLDEIDGILNTLVLFFLTLGLLGFVYNVIRYFVIESTNEQGREKAKKYALWSILGFVAVVSIWGMVSLLIDSSGIDKSVNLECSDYLIKIGSEYCN